MIEHLLVPIDGGALDDRAFDVSIALARQLRAAITGFIVEPFASPPPPSAAPAGAMVSTEATLVAHARSVLARFEQRAQEAGVPFHGVATQSSHVSEAILAAAREHACDMIVMVTRGRGPIGELLWGSNTREVLAHTKLPVLVLH